MWTERLRNCLAREALGRLHLPPWLFGHRYLRRREPSEFDCELIDAATVSRVPLPSNVASRDQLPDDASLGPCSFRDVPERPVSETFFATIPRCRVLVGRDQWDNGFYAIVTENDEEVGVRGTQYIPAMHAPLMRRGAPRVHLQRATWILEQWDRNWGHWLQWHLVKIALLQKHGRGANIVIPERNRMSDAAEASLDALGFDRTTAHRLSSSVIEVDELTVVGMDAYRASLLDDLRNRLLVSPARRDRKLFISRAKAARRRLRNEDECWSIFEAHGYESMVMDEHSFDAQRALIGEAAVIAGLHGSGLVNVIFGAPGLEVIEIASGGFNPQIYALCGALQHRYRVLFGTPVGEGNLNDQDVAVDAGELRDVVERVDVTLRHPERSEGSPAA